jgi:two-component system, sensor histidine kinase and response regulator
MVNRILVVEDNAVLRELMQRQIRSLGYNCYAVPNGEEAIELAAFFDLVLMDVQLPGISGIEATVEIRRRETEFDRWRVPIVATTCQDIRSQCLTAGMDDFYEKPIARRDLVAILNKWVVERPTQLRLLG